MNNRILVGLLICLLVLLPGCGKKNVNEQTPPTEVVQQTEAATESIPETTIPGLEDSIFDDETTPATEMTSNEETEPDAASSNNNQVSQDGGSNDGLQEPDSPGQKPGTSQKPEATQPATEPETQPTETEPQNQNRSEYEAFQNMSPAEQQTYMNSFETIDAFFAWYNTAREEHENMYPDIEIGNGSVDMGDIIN